MSRVLEAGQNPSLSLQALHETKIGAIQGRDVKGIQVEHLVGTIGQHDLPARRVEVPNEEGRLLYLDLPPEVGQLHHEAALLREIPDGPIEGGPQSPVPDRLALVGPGSVMMETQPKGP